jgi:two-component sensor histidine kinase
MIKTVQLGHHSYRLVFQDNGPGLPSVHDFEHPTTIGFSMVKSLVMQLHGTIGYTYEQGSKFILEFNENSNAG